MDGCVKAQTVNTKAMPSASMGASSQLTLHTSTSHEMLRKFLCSLH